MKKSFILLSIVIIVFIGFFLFFGFPWKHKILKEQITTVLENRYNDEFSLDILRYKILNGDAYYTTATAQKTGESFYVEISKDGEKVQDAYTLEYWSAVITEYMKPLSDKYFSNYVLNGDIVEIKQTIFQREQLKDSPDSAIWNVYFDFKYYWPSENANEELKKILNVIQILKKEHFVIDSMILNYSGRSFEIQNIHNTNFEDIGDVNFIER